jgi:hypothetical protein
MKRKSRPESEQYIVTGVPAGDALSHFPYIIAVDLGVGSRIAPHTDSLYVSALRRY